MKLKAITTALVFLLSIYLVNADDNFIKVKFSGRTPDFRGEKAA